MPGGFDASGVALAVLGPAIATCLAGLAVAILVAVALVKHGAEMTCPICTARVARGSGDCPECGFEFAPRADLIE